MLGYVTKMFWTLAVVASVILALVSHRISPLQALLVAVAWFALLRAGALYLAWLDRPTKTRDA